MADEWWAWLLAIVGLLGLTYVLARHLAARTFHLGLLVVLGAVGGTALDNNYLSIWNLSSWQWQLVWAAGGIAALRWLNAVNARYRPRTLAIGEFTDEAGQRRYDLERLLEEGFYKASLHSPSAIPGGMPHYWRHFASDLNSLTGQDRLSKALQAGGAVLRITQPPHSLDIKGAVIRAPPREVSPQQGVRIQATDTRTGELVLADTFWGATVHEAVELASYGLAASAFFRCPFLPAWVHWEGRDGIAVQRYWRACNMLKWRGGQQVEHAQRLFEEAVACSPGTAYATFQLAGLIELKELRIYKEGSEGAEPSHEIRRSPRPNLVRALSLYGDLLARHPHLLLAWFRLASVLGNVAQWVPRLPEGEVATHEKTEKLTGQLQETARLVFHALSPLNPPGLSLELASWREGDGFCSDEKKQRKHALAASQAILRWLSEVIHLRVLGWCALNLAERRWFSMTVLYPASERLALHRSLLAALDCVEVQILSPLNGGCSCSSLAARLVGHLRARAGRESDLLQEFGLKELLVGWGEPLQELFKMTLPQLTQCHPQDGNKCQKHLKGFLALLAHAEALEREVERFSLNRGEWWGAAQYSLGCFYAQMLALAKSDQLKGSRPNERCSGVAEDYWARRAVSLLRRSARDTKSPLGEDRRRWFEVDPDLEGLQHHPSFLDWRGTQPRERPKRRRRLRLVFD